MDLHVRPCVRLNSYLRRLYPLGVAIRDFRSARQFCAGSGLEAFVHSSTWRPITSDDDTAAGVAGSALVFASQLAMVVLGHVWVPDIPGG